MANEAMLVDYFTESICHFSYSQYRNHFP